MTPDLPSDPPIRFISLPTGDVAYTDQGSGLPLVAVHGTPGSSKDFRWLGATLETKIRFIRLDLPGFGSTPLETMPKFGLHQCAKLVLAFTEALDLKRFVLLGHSMGGGVSVITAAMGDPRIAGLALIASPGLRPHRLLRMTKGSRFASSVLCVPGLRYLILPLARSSFRRAGFPKSVQNNAIVQSIHAAAAIDFTLVGESVRALDLPTLMSWAEDDRLIETEIYSEMSEACPEGPRLLFPTGGHNIQKTRAVEISATIIPWMQTLIDS